MEELNKELDKLIDTLEHSANFKNNLDNVKSIYPFSRYEYIISKLLSKQVLHYEEYLELRDNYINRNLFLYVFEISAPRGFGDTWAFSHLLSIEPELKRPNKKVDPSYKGEYDLYLPYPTGNIKIEVKASRAVNRDKADEPLYTKALSSNENKRFLMNFQQLKPSCCDVFLWLAVYRNCVKYWVLKNDVIKNHLDFTPQHRNEATEKRKVDYDRTKIFEGQIMITNDNINSISEYIVEGRGIRQAIIEQFEN
ncbi:MAG TPA: hypothetical protein PLH82_03665 [Candidatus Paceibacterota bacterium]|nr:hypothetical protein [Treponema sp.]HOE15718.1 hypothetical protein [Candidatus Paceibacterota bacterium]